MNTFDRITHAVGDFGSPFYSDERRRDLYNEASAVGMQIMLWGGLGVAFAMAWFGGTAAVPWTVAVLGLIGASTCTMVAMMTRRDLTGGEAVARGRQFASRVAAFVVLYSGTVLGLLLRLPSEDGFVGGMRVGVGIGAALAVAGLLLAGLRHRRDQES